MSISIQLALLQKPMNTSVMIGTEGEICGDDDMQHICDAINHARLIGKAFLIVQSSVDLSNVLPDGTPKYDNDKKRLSALNSYLTDLIAGMGDDNAENISSFIEPITSDHYSIFKVTILIGPPSQTP